MNWADDGIVIALQPFGERDGVLEAFTRTHGRHKGLVRGGSSSRQGSVLLAGNTVALRWSARLDGYLGRFAVEPVQLRAANLMIHPISLLAAVSALSHLRLLGERDADSELYTIVDELLQGFAQRGTMCYVVGIALACFEFVLLDRMGFALAVERCAVTGGWTDVAFVSPRTGRGISTGAAGQWRQRLLPLPPVMQAFGQRLAACRQGGVRSLPACFAFARDQAGAASSEAVQQALAIGAHFLRRHVYHPAGCTWVRARARVARGLANPGVDPARSEKPVDHARVSARIAGP